MTDPSCIQITPIGSAVVDFLKWGVLDTGRFALTFGGQYQATTEILAAHASAVQEGRCPLGPAAHLVAEPGDGTRYDLVVVQDPHGGWLVGWPATGALFWASMRKGGEVKRKGEPATVCIPEPPDYDCQIIGTLLDETVRQVPFKLTQHTSAAELALNEIAAACGAREWQSPGQVVRDVLAVVKITRDLARSIERLDGVGAQEVYQRAVDAVGVLDNHRAGAFRQFLAPDASDRAVAQGPSGTPDQVERRRTVFELAADLGDAESTRLVAMRVADPALTKRARAPVTQVDEVWRSLVHLGLVTLDKADLKMVVHGHLARTTPLGAQVRALRVAWATSQRGL